MDFASFMIGVALGAFVALVVVALFFLLAPPPERTR